MQDPLNFATIERWVRENRKDLIPMIGRMKTENAFILLLSIGFESGRQFQFENPRFPLGDPSGYSPEFLDKSLLGK